MEASIDLEQLGEGLGLLRPGLELRFDGLEALLVPPALAVAVDPAGEPVHGHTEGVGDGDEVLGLRHPVGLIPVDDSPVRDVDPLGELNLSQPLLVLQL